MSVIRDNQFLKAIKARQELEILVNSFNACPTYTLSKKLNLIKKAKILSKQDLNLCYSIMKEGNQFAHDPNHNADLEWFEHLISTFEYRKDFLASALKNHTKQKDEVVDVKPTTIGKFKNEIVRVNPHEIKKHRKIHKIRIENKHLVLVRDVLFAILALYLAYVWFCKFIPLIESIDVTDSAFIYFIKRLSYYIKQDLTYVVKFYLSKEKQLAVKVYVSILYIIFYKILRWIFNFLTKESDFNFKITEQIIFIVPFIIGMSYAVFSNCYIEGFFIYILIGLGLCSLFWMSGLYLLFDWVVISRINKLITKVFKVNA